MNRLLGTILVSTGLALPALAVVSPFNDTLTLRGAAQRNASAGQTNDPPPANGEWALPIDPRLGDDGITTIVIDAGHGGHDGGCSGSVHGAREKVIALQLALGLGNRLREVYPDMKVILTRDRDVFVPLHERAAVANDAQADLFISIHCNAMPRGSSVHGSETYVMGLHTAQHNLDVAKRENAAIRLEKQADQHYDFDPDSPAGHIILSMFQHAFLEQSMVLAANIEDQLAARGGHHSRGVKQAGFLVLKETAMPSVLVETGYLTNASEEAYLKSDSGQAETVESLYGGVARYLRQRGGQEGASRPVLASLKTSTEVRKVQTTDELQHLGALSEPGSPLVAPVGDTDAGGVAFYIQLAAAKAPLTTMGANYTKLGSPIRYVKEGELLKYQAGPFPTREAAMRAQRTARANGFSGAFLTAYRYEHKLTPAELAAHQR